MAKTWKMIGDNIGLEESNIRYFECSNHKSPEGFILTFKGIINDSRMFQNVNLLLNNNVLNSRKNIKRINRVNANNA